jgi:hypothetical protein
MAWRSQAITAPATYLSAITVAAYKRHVVVALIHHGAVAPFPKYTSSVVQRHIKAPCAAYTELATAYATHSHDEVRPPSPSTPPPWCSATSRRRVPRTRSSPRRTPRTRTTRYGSLPQVHLLRGAAPRQGAVRATSSTHPAMDRRPGGAFFVTDWRERWGCRWRRAW